MTQYTLEDVKAWALAEIEIEGEGFIYKESERGNGLQPACYYYEDGQPSCLIGRMLDRNGVITPNVASDSLNANSVYSLIRELDLKGAFTTEARQFMSGLQCGQDLGETWGAAYAEALRRYRDFWI